MLRYLRAVTDRIFDQPALYHAVRAAFLGGLPTAPVVRLLEAGPTDVIVDVGCGTGDLAEQVPFRRYFGFDSDPKVIAIARAKNIAGAEFTVDSALDYDLRRRAPTRAVLYGVLHHIPDEDAVRLLRALDDAGAAAIVTLDPVYSRYHVLNNVLCRLDRGRYVRTEEEMDALVQRAGLEAETRLVHYSNSKVAKYISYRLRRRPAPASPQASGSPGSSPAAGLRTM